jgi:cation diffusion facilitator CzcD-associated flavoprotein CzcO
MHENKLFCTSPVFPAPTFGIRLHRTIVFVSMAPSKEVIIVGGGISGLGMAVQLKRMLGHDNFTIFEKSDNIGGTWWHNRYPACACDIPSHFYSYSFALKPDWSSMYPGRDELHSCKAPRLAAFASYD